MKQRAGFTIDDIRKAPCAKLNDHLLVDTKPKKSKKKVEIGGTIISKIYPQSSKEKMSIEVTLFEFTQQNAIILFGEYRFHTERRWRFDWYFELNGKKYAVEYNGIMSEKSRHTTIKGYSGDMDKINAANSLGIQVLQYTPLNYKNIQSDLKQIKIEK